MDPAPPLRTWSLVLHAKNGHISPFESMPVPKPATEAVAGELEDAVARRVARLRGAPSHAGVAGVAGEEP